ncbi:dTDP-4-dehydrorhamnose 3,5-epimerase [Streptomyces sp. NA02950]|uniref:dTDP-4-dehydrorhamnose 3,5-epimerase n=1 Tax=Streptomyces sp. NA02950 TaxID=2742137 RepID=UPI00159128D3|nr:dTDP-4-dehydrorhamnose 3,5-epimerase [Streptomyces sp. NA02950]QKV97160.1 dTDP-4-dehydrorhamnose 3,5-epimerase [Streptomyces sp. NA02950]
MTPLAISGAWMVEPNVLSDSRGNFHEWFRGPEFREAVGYQLSLAQANCSVSKRGTLRGIHFANVPPGQAKYVKCLRGAVLDVIVDVRTGSPTYKQWNSVRLDDHNHRAVYLSEGLGHAFMALTDDAMVIYLCSESYAPQREHGTNPLDPELAIAWPESIEPLLSDKDAAAPSMVEAERQGLLPSYAECVALDDMLRTREAL